MQIFQSALLRFEEGPTGDKCYFARLGRWIYLLRNYRVGLLQRHTLLQRNFQLLRRHGVRHLIVDRNHYLFALVHALDLPRAALQLLLQLQNQIERPRNDGYMLALLPALALLAPQNPQTFGYMLEKGVQLHIAQLKVNFRLPGLELRDAA